MKIAAPLIVAVLLTACSKEEGAATTEGASRASTAARTQVQLPTQDNRGAATTTTGMRASVSDLTGAVSGLKTRVTDMALIIDLPADALFDYDKATLTPAAESQLLKAADVIRRSPPGSIQVVGHTDNHGGDDYNIRLSEARAAAVVGWLKQQVGIRQRTVNIVGKGEAEPVAPNTRADGSDDPAGRAKNRRVELVVPNTTANGI
ncbi:MAG: OmpA family protein [Burkholderiales bacterium]|nr:MAG: OmpA family protein [Burkholderiales bacterium]